ncbi:MAG: ParB/RepB/Spo0J family partition protein [Candidatus Nanopelagicales bacterium]
MAAKRGGLGRGLGALIPTSEPAEKNSEEAIQPISGMQLSEVELNLIDANPKQPRKVFEEDAMNELAYSLREIGLLQPIVVRAKGKNRYELIAGERRLRAAKMAELKTIPVIIKATDDEAMLRDALLENLHRSNLNPLEEAAAYQQLLEDFSCTQDELAIKIGRSRPQISNTLRLLKLPTNDQKRVAAGVLSAGHAKALLGLSDSTTIEQLANKIVAEGLSVRATEELVSLGFTQEAEVTRRKTPNIKAPGLKDLSQRLEDVLDTRVNIQIGKNKGKIIIEFATMEDLRRVIEVIEK